MSHLRHILSSIIVLLCLPVLAQQSSTHLVNIRGRVLERQSLDVLVGASAKLFNESDSLIAGAITQSDGIFTIPKIATGTYTMSITYLGYKEQRFQIKLPNRAGNFRIDDVLMREDAKLLQEAVVEGKLPEMTVVDDTLVYNADAFKVADGDMVEELVKKLPGIVYEEDGTFTYNGKPVSQVLVDGKEFFGTNSKFTLQNIPAEIVDKIKAYEKKSDRARITGIDDGNERTVLDLTIKKNRKKGFFGNADGGYGTKDRYNGGLRMNNFIGDKKFSVTGDARNTNGGGRSDDQRVGATMHWENKKIELNGSLTGNFNQSDSESRSNSQNFELQSSAFSNNHNWNESRSRNFNFQYTVEWKPDSLWNIRFLPGASWGDGSNSNGSESATFRSNPYDYTDDPLKDYLLLRPDSALVNHRMGRNSSGNDNYSMRASVEINRRLGKPGRNINFSFGGNYSEGNNNSRNFTETDYYRILAGDGTDSVYHKTQFNSGSNKNYSFNGSVSYSEPIAREMYLQASYSASYNWRDNRTDVRSIFDPYNDSLGVNVDNYRDFRDSPFAVVDKQQSSYSTNTYVNQDARLQLRINRTHYQLTVGGNVRPQYSRIDYHKGRIDTTLTRTVVNVAPTFNFRYKFSQQEQLNLRYNGNSGQPNMLDMIPDTLNDANPLNIRIGNARLKPSFTHNVNFDYNWALPTKQRSFATNLQFHTTQNSTTQRTEYNEETGGRISMPVNVDGNWNASANINFNTALDSAKHFSVSTETSFRHSNAVGFNYRSDLQQSVRRTTRETNMGERLRFTYRKRWINEYQFEANVSGGFYYNLRRSTNANVSNLDNFNFNYGGSLHFETPWGMTIRTDISEQSRRGYQDAAMNTNKLIWGASISQRCLPHKILTLTLRAQDILGQRDDVNRSVSATSRTDTQNYLVHSYVMFTANLRFGYWPGMKVDWGNRRNGEGRGEARGEGRGQRGEGGQGGARGGGGNRGGGGGRGGR